jgi:hypothetical protein
MKPLKHQASGSTDQTAWAADGPYIEATSGFDSNTSSPKKDPIRERQLSVGRILDVEDVAAVFKCCTEKVKRLMRSGKLPAFKWGGRWYVREKDLERMIDGAVNSTCHLRRVQEAA